MKNIELLTNLLKLLFNLDTTEESLLKIFKQITIRNSIYLMEDLFLTQIPTNDKEFEVIYNHACYNDLKEILDKFKHIKDFKLPNKL